MNTYQKAYQSLKREDDRLGKPKDHEKQLAQAQRKLDDAQRKVESAERVLAKLRLMPTTDVRRADLERAMESLKTFLGDTASFVAPKRPRAAVNEEYETVLNAIRRVSHPVTVKELSVLLGIKPARVGQRLASIDKRTNGQLVRTGTAGNYRYWWTPISSNEYGYSRDLVGVGGN